MTERKEKESENTEPITKNKKKLQLQHWYVSGLCENYKLHVQKGTADQRKKKKTEEWEYLHCDYIICKELIKIWIWFDRKWDSSP